VTEYTQNDKNIIYKIGNSQSYS